MQTKGAIFDLDGVIVNTAKFHYLGWKKLADEIGVAFDETKNEKLKGLSRRDSLIALLGKTPPESQLQEMCERKNRYYLEFVAKIDRSELLPGALQFVEELSRTPGWKRAVASSSKNAPLILEKLNIVKYFDAVLDGNSTEKTKPDPELFLIAARKLGVSTSQTVVFEDAESGVRAAKAGKMLAVGIGDPQTLHEADLVVKDLSEMSVERAEKLFSKALTA